MLSSTHNNRLLYCMNYRSNGKKGKQSRSSSTHNNRGNDSTTESIEDDELDIIDSKLKREDAAHSNTVNTSRYWMAEEVQKLKNLKARGMSDDEIGKVIGRSTTAVDMKWRRINSKKLCIDSLATSLHISAHYKHSLRYREEEQQDDGVDEMEMDSQSGSEEEEDDEFVIGAELSSAEDCLEWMQSIGYGHYVSKLRRQWIEDKMDGETLKMLDQSDLV